MTHPAHEAGFIMLDALMAVALIALSGSVVAAISIQQLQQQDRMLDRSVALVMSQSLMHQYLAFGSPGSGPASFEDELFNYRIAIAPQTVDSKLLVTLRVVAEAKSGRDEVHLEFLAPRTLTP